MVLKWNKSDNDVWCTLFSENRIKLMAVHFDV